MENKECKKCKNLLPLNNYYVSITGLIGRVCKKCLSEASRKKREPDVEARKLQKKLEIENAYQEKLKECGDGVPRKEDVLTKKCIKCGQVLALNQFRKHGKADDAYQNACKKCYTEKRKQIFLKHNTERFRTHEYIDGKVSKLSCNRCKEILPLSSFSIRKYGEEEKENKYISTCKSCCRQAEIQRKRQTTSGILVI